MAFLTQTITYRHREEHSKLKEPCKQCPEAKVYLRHLINNERDAVTGAARVKLRRTVVESRAPRCDMEDKLTQGVSGDL